LRPAAWAACRGSAAPPRLSVRRRRPELMRPGRPAERPAPRPARAGARCLGCTRALQRPELVPRPSDPLHPPPPGHPAGPPASHPAGQVARGGRRGSELAAGIPRRLRREGGRGAGVWGGGWRRGGAAALPRARERRAAPPSRRCRCHLRPRPPARHKTFAAAATFTARDRPLYSSGPAVRTRRVLGRAQTAPPRTAPEHGNRPLGQSLD
jgi:hypothetical protein